MLLYERLLTGLRSYAAARLLTQVISWAGTVYIVRQLDSHAFGLFGMSVVALNYVSMVYDGTLTETLVQRYPQDRQEHRATFTLLMGIGVLTTALLAGLAWPLAHFLKEPDVAPLIVAMSSVLLMSSLSVLPHAKLIREMTFPRIAMVSALQALVTTVTSVGLAYRGDGAWALVIGTIAGLALRAVALNVLAPSITLPTFAIRRALGYLRFGGVLLADNALWRWYVSLDTLLLGRWVGAQSLGYYSVAQQLADMPLEKISTIVNDVSLPAYAQLSGNRPEAARLMLETIRMHAIVGFAVFWGLAAVAPLAVPVVFGAKWAPAVFPLMALCAIAPLRLIGSIETPAMTGLGQPRVLLKTKLVIVPCMTLAFVVGCGLGGITGAALAWLCAFPLCYGLAFRFVLRAAGLPYAHVLAALRGPAMAGALMVLVVFAFVRLLALAATSDAIALCIGIAIGAVAYIGALRWTDRTAFVLMHGRVNRFFGLRAAA